jgi:hypothetical protein
VLPSTSQSQSNENLTPTQTSRVLPIANDQPIQMRVDNLEERLNQQALLITKLTSVQVYPLTYVSCHSACTSKFNCD